MWSDFIIAAGSNLVGLELDAIESDVDIFLLLGSPIAPVHAYVTIKDTAAITSITTGDMPAGSTVQFIHEGYFLGAGGDGGVGGINEPGGGGEPPLEIHSSPGQLGGISLIMLCAVIINMDEGRIWGGGGGGGGGGSNIGQGGGGGGGVTGGLGVNQNGTDATIGITAVPGSGGSAGGSDGGDGGDWGGSGGAGDTVGPGFGEEGAPGGNGGLAIETNGFLLTFLGKDETQLRAEDRIKGVIL